MKYYYFFSFICENSEGMAHGNTTLTLDEKVRNSDDIKEVQEYIELNNNVRKVTILNIVLLDSEVVS